MRTASRATLGVGALILSLSYACALGRGAKARTGPRLLGHVTPQERAEYIRRATVWRPTKVGAMDLLHGPDGKGSFELWQQVTCDYHPWDKPISGATPKFLCDLGGGDVVKVKYGKKNGEVYAEVAATRLFWALGFGADRMYPVEVTCRNCPIEPWYWNSERRVEQMRFEVASIERKVEGKRIEADKREGWDWREIDQVDERVGGAPRAHRDGLKLLMVFLQNSDNKAPNQDLVCLPDGLKRDEAGNEDCTKTYMYVQDQGLGFGKATLLNTSRIDLDTWRAEPIWRDPRQCIGNLRKTLTSSLANPRISEGGRRFLADLLVQLSDQQIRDMFVAGRMDRLDRETRADGGERKVTLDDWVGVFKKKRDEVVNARCPQ